METTTQLPVGTIIMELLGGLALFLFGMSQMTDALKIVAGESMRKLLSSLTRNRFMGAITGIFVTAVIQSSSVTTVLLVGFISAGLMTLPQSVGVILGAKVGTTVTAQIIAFKVTQYALALVAVGFGLLFVMKKETAKLYGAMIMGLGLIFFGMGLMSDATAPLRTYEPFIEIMKSMDHPALGLLAGAAFTALVQSSSATTGIVIVLASQGFITLEAGIALAFGANVGTCVTALLAALGKPRPAVRAAAVHILLAIAGVTIWLPWITQLAVFVSDISPSYPDLEGTARLAAETPRQIANAFTTFNLANLFVFIGFTGLIAKLVTKLLPDKPEVVPERARPEFLDEVYLATPALALDRVHRELIRLGKQIAELIPKMRNTIAHGTRQDIAAVVAEESESERLYEAIIGYIRKLNETAVDAEHVRTMVMLTNIANHIQHIGETIATNMVAIGRQRLDLGLEMSAATREAFAPFGSRVRVAYATVLEALEEQDLEKARAVVAMKHDVHSIADGLRDHLSRRLVADEPNRLSLFRIENDVIEITLRLFYFAKKIAKELIQGLEPEPRDPEQTVQLPAIGAETEI